MAREIIRNARAEYPCSKGCGHVIKVGEKHRDINSGGMRICMACNNQPAKPPMVMRSRLRGDLPETSALAARVRAGATLVELAAELDFSTSGLRARLSSAGFDTSGQLRDVELCDLKSYLRTALLTWAEPWMSDGICAQTDPESFYPEKGGSTAEAKRVCMGCPVRDTCLQYALEHHERFGIWGGKSERERRKIAKQVAA